MNLSQEQFEEIYRCFNDPFYYILNYAWIEIKEKSKVIPFIPTEDQMELLRWVFEGENGVVLKSRRIGASTAVSVAIGWLINFRRGVNALLLSENEDKAKKLLLKVKFSLFNLRYHGGDPDADFESCPEANWLLNIVSSNSQHRLAIGWTNDKGEIISTSEVSSLTTTARSGAGESATLVFLDEFAFLPEQEETMRAARLTAMRGGNWIIVSTPNGAGDVFHSLCMRAERGESETYNFIKSHWRDAGITDAEVLAGTEGMSEDSLLQELELTFISSGDPVFNQLHLNNCYKPIQKYPGRWPELEQEIAKYKSLHEKEPENYYYFSGVDTAVGKLTKKGSKRDYHSFTSLTKSGIQVFAYHTKRESLTDWAGNIETLASVGPVHRIGTVSKLHKKYPGFVQIEENGPGVQVINNHQVPGDGFSDFRGVVTSAKTKGGLGGYINQLVLAIESHSIIITDEFTYQCLLVFQRGTTPGMFSAPKGDYYDDPVISLALAYDGLLRQGKLEFSWGESVDKLQEVPYQSHQIDAINAERVVGPQLVPEAGPNDRLADHFDGHNPIFIGVGFGIDLGKIREPEFDYEG